MNPCNIKVGDAVTFLAANFGVPREGGWVGVVLEEFEDEEVMVFWQGSIMWRLHKSVLRTISSGACK